MKYTGGKLIYGQIKCYIFTLLKSYFQEFLSWQVPTHGGNPTPQPPAPSLGLLQVLWGTVTSGSSLSSVFWGFVHIFFFLKKQN